jgi:hemoglobin
VSASFVARRIDVTSTSLFEFAGGTPAFDALAGALHERCFADPVLSHAFSHADQHPEHVQRLAGYLAEVSGGPAWYSTAAGGHTGMLSIHAGQGAETDLGRRFVAAFVGAMDDASLPADPAFRAAMRRSLERAVDEVIAYSPAGSVVPDALPMPRWDWGGPSRG